MAPALPRPNLSFAEYANAEEASDEKHEFLAGEVFAMAGGTPEHAALATAVSNALGTQLRGGDCRSFNSDLHLVTKSGLGTYPDVAVVCGKLERATDSQRTITNPRLIVEVLSPTTEAYDRGKKFEHYRTIDTLREYVLISFREPLIESHTRNADGSWTSRFAGGGEILTLTSVGATLSVDEIYRGLSRVDGVMRLP